MYDLTADAEEMSKLPSDFLEIKVEKKIRVYLLRSIRTIQVISNLTYLIKWVDPLIIFH
jgi:hypothetical protein